MGLMTAGGGLSSSKLKATTAQPGDVLLNKTFYSGDKNIKTGTFNLGAANATPDKVLNGASFYSNGNKTLQWGTIWPQGAQTWASSLGISGNTIYVRFPKGAYLQAAGSGYPEIMVSRSDSFKIGQATIQMRLGDTSTKTIDVGHTIIGFQSINTSGDAGGVNGGDYSVNVTYSGSVITASFNIGYTDEGFGNVTINYMYIS